MSKTTNNADIEQPSVAWTEDGTAIRIVAPADFTPKQQQEFYDSWLAWWDVYSTEMNAKVRARMFADCPPAPACASWCTVTHQDALKGWETLEVHAGRAVPDSVQKTCRAVIGDACCDDGSVQVYLDRIACVDNLGTRWSALYVGDETVSLHPDVEFARMDRRQLVEFLKLLMVGAEQLAAGQAS